MASTRHEIRTLVVQSLYASDFGGTLRDKDSVLGTFNTLATEASPELINNQFAETIISGIVGKLDELDSIIERVAPNWPLDKLGVVERNVIRMGIFELLFGKTLNVPGRVAINEAIELAKSFAGEGGSKFVNGVLGTIFREIGGDTETVVVKKTRRVVKSTGGLVYHVDDSGEIRFALIKDIFGKWTLSKGKLQQKETAQRGVTRVIQEELGLATTIDEEIGFNSYISYPPEGPLRKEVVYFLVRARENTITLEKKDGLVDAQWFTKDEVSKLKLYKDIQEMIFDAMLKISSEVARAVKK